MRLVSTATMHVIELHSSRTMTIILTDSSLAYPHRGNSHGHHHQARRQVKSSGLKKNYK